MDHITYVNKSYIGVLNCTAFLYFSELNRVINLSQGLYSGWKKIFRFVYVIVSRAFYYEMHFVIYFRRTLITAPFTSGCEFGARSSSHFDP